MNLNTDILQKLNEIYNNREEAICFEEMLRNFKQDRAILLINSRIDKQFSTDDYDVVINSIYKVPLELLERLTQTVQDYIDEQCEKITQVQIDNLPWDED